MEVALAVSSVTAQILAVISGEQNQCVGQVAPAVQCLQQRADAIVQVCELPEVVGLHPPDVGVIMALAGCGRYVGGQGHGLGVVHVAVRPRGVKGGVGSREADTQKHGPLPGAGLDVPLRLPSYIAVDVLVGGQGGRPHDMMVAPDESLGNVVDVGLEHPPFRQEPGVLVAEIGSHVRGGQLLGPVQAQRIVVVPMVPMIFPRFRIEEVVLADLGRGIALLPQRTEQRHPVGRELETREVVPEAVPVGKLAAYQGTTGRHAHRRGGIGVVKAHPCARQSVQVGGAHRGIAIAAHHARVPLIREDQDDIGRRGGTRHGWKVPLVIGTRAGKDTLIPWIPSGPGPAPVAAGPRHRAGSEAATTRWRQPSADGWWGPPRCRNWRSRPGSGARWRP